MLTICCIDRFMHTNCFKKVEKIKNKMIVHIIELILNISDGVVEKNYCFLTWQEKSTACLLNMGFLKYTKNKNNYTLKIYRHALKGIEANEYVNLSKALKNMNFFLFINIFKFELPVLTDFSIAPHICVKP